MESASAAVPRHCQLKGGSFHGRVPNHLLNYGSKDMDEKERFYNKILHLVMEHGVRMCLSLNLYAGSIFTFKPQIYTSYNIDLCVSNWQPSPLAD